MKSFVQVCAGFAGLTSSKKRTHANEENLFCQGLRHTAFHKRYLSVSTIADRGEEKASLGCRFFAGGLIEKDMGIFSRGVTG
jgi:hypothetical protein